MEEILSARSSQSSIVAPVGDVVFSDPLCVYSPQFVQRQRNEKEQLFLRAYEEKVAFIRSKELISGDTTPVQPESSEGIDKLQSSRDQFTQKKNNEQLRSDLTRAVTTQEGDLAPRISTASTPTFSPLLNTGFNSQLDTIETFKKLIQATILRNRVKSRCHKLTQYLSSAQTDAVAELNEGLGKKPISAAQLLSVRIRCARPKPKFSYPEEMPIIEPPEASVTPHRIEQVVQLVKPGIAEKYQLARTPITNFDTFVPVPISAPEKFPIVTEELPIREEKPIITEEIKFNRKQPENPALPFPKAVHHVRDIQYMDIEPFYCLRPQPLPLDPIPNEIGCSATLSMTPTIVNQLSLTRNVRSTVVPFSFLGTPHYSLPLMEGPNEEDLRELAPDDDIDDIDVKPKAKPITDFLKQPTATKNKSHQIVEAVSEGQIQWREKQRKSATELLERTKGLNKLLNDQTLSVGISDVDSFLLS